MPARALAYIDVYPKELVIEDGKPGSVRVTNLGSKPEYVSVSLSRLLNPGVPLPEERLQAVAEMQRPVLFAAPFRLSLAPGQSKTISLKPLEPVSTEAVYRLDVQPVFGDLDTGRSGATGMVVITVAYSVLVRQLPDSQKASLTMTCEAGGGRLAVDGNVRHEVKDVQVDGQAIEPFNVYPGTPRFLAGNRITAPGQPMCESRAR